MSGGIGLSTSSTIREEQVAAAGGVFAETIPMYAASGATILSSGQAQYAGVFLRAGETVTNLHVFVTIAGAGQTLVKMGVRDTAGASLAASADVKATFTGTGFLTVPMGSAWTPSENGLYYFGILGVGGTQPTLLRAANVTSGSFAGVSGYKWAANEGSQTDWDATCTYGNSFPFWIAAS